MPRPPAKEGIFLLNQKRIDTMRNRLGDASELVNNDQFLPRARRVQMDITAEEFDAICQLARQASNPQHYFMKIIAKDAINRTLSYIRRVLKRSVEAISYISQKLKNKSRSWIEFVADKIADGHYSMANVVEMVRISQDKQHPDRYLVGILKNGYTPWEARNGG